MMNSKTLIRAAITVCIGMAAFLAIPAARAQCGPSKNTKPLVYNLAPAANALRLALTPSTRTNPDAKSQGQPSIVGLWNMTFLSGGQVVDQGFDVWHSDGTELLNDNPPPSTGNVCVGVWVQTDRNSYRLYHPSWNFDSKGNVIGTAVIRETVNVDATTGDSLTGTFTLDFFDNYGNALPGQSLSGTLKGTRIVPD
ncbi:MAG TPA: hypothetical protein VML19_15320 [Verrucomicrobiae bacterium]|nr:hypothetical protein [Verrucomicrobiae bacterium]